MNEHDLPMKDASDGAGEFARDANSQKVKLLLKLLQIQFQISRHGCQFFFFFFCSLIQYGEILKLTLWMELSHFSGKIEFLCFDGPG
jgi:hypothetical protein